MNGQQTATPCPEWCDGRKRPEGWCDSGFGPDGRFLTYHGADGTHFDFRDGRDGVAGWVDITRADYDGQVGVVRVSPHLDEFGEATMTAAQARQVAAAFLNAADRVDEITAAGR